MSRYPVAIGGKADISLTISQQFWGEESPRVLGNPALCPSLRPAFRVRRGERSLCVAMRCYAQAIRRGAPCDFMPTA
jgi:hypothetical protein